MDGIIPVSYTHLDVYKRQVKDLPIDASLKDKILYENAAGLLKLE